VTLRAERATGQELTKRLRGGHGWSRLVGDADQYA
jgi:hypothetical protein